jgi:nitrate reductase gamma subunit
MSLLKKVFYPLAAVAALVLAAAALFWIPALHFASFIVLPYLAAALFIAGFIYRVVMWAQSPVPFNIPTTCGQESSLDWIKSDRFENPRSTWDVAVRMILEILFFRSLFRNSRAQQVQDRRLVYGGSRWLWLISLLFHWSLFFILVRHLRFFTEPILPPALWVSGLDGVFQLALPTLFITDFIVLITLTCLFIRRIAFSQWRYLSLASDYLALLLIAAVVISGVLMRSVFKADLLAVKQLALSMLMFQPSLPAGISLPFSIHLVLACSLIAYFPFSKMMHAPGILFSPTRNLRNDSRLTRHVNPWDRPVRVHTYAEYEDEFRNPMKKAGLPLEVEPAPAEK